MTNKNKKQRLQLYLHIPFCVRKCAYCDFLSGPAGESQIEEYVSALVSEIKSCQKAYYQYEVSTVFLGGGTPSILTGMQIERVFSALYENFDICQDAEISMEMNPGTVTMEKLLAYRNAGINRLSIGLQSVSDEELRLLGRIHTMQEFLDTYQMARACGFRNINVDLISAIPGQTPKSWRNTLRTVAELKPEHISAYSLIVEEGTPFYEKYGAGECLPDEETEREMYHDTKTILAELGYHRYEISNYAREGYECRHNLGYWQRENYLGLGVGAASLIENRRFSHIADRDIYIEKIKAGKFSELTAEEETLDDKAQMEEFMFLGLRVIRGVSKQKFYDQFRQPMDAVYGEVLRSLASKKLMINSDGQAALTERGIDISNYVMSEFLL